MQTKAILNALFVTLVLALLLPISATSISWAINSQSQTNSVSSNGINESMILMEVVPYSSSYQVGQPIQAYTISGAQILCLLGSSKTYCQQWIRVFIDASAPTFTVNQSNAISKLMVVQKSPTVYWDVTPPNSSTQYGTVGQDLDTANNTLSEWQWANPNHLNSGGWPSPPASMTGSFDGGSPSACSVNSGGSFHISDYTMIIDQNTGMQIRVMGAELIQSQWGSVRSATVALIFVNLGDEFPIQNHGPQLQSCPEVMSPTLSPQLRWFVREPPTNFIRSGDFGVMATIGAGLKTTTTDQVMQFANIYSVSGYMPSEICATCVLAPAQSSTSRG
ncbi:MAG: hypothetical protein ACYC7D_03165 [Nitrososphaerales archaeon]